MAVHKYVPSEGGDVLSLHGENFLKTNPPLVFFGSEQSQHVEVRSPELLICRPPPSLVAAEGNGMRRPVVLVRSDGVVFPTGLIYP